ncbi:MAG TPA: hypothetical protein VFM80_03375 [Gracilimonas sp.]|uniref:hypothetical protein n=1 Tax=Gracilimonas sp. TaxID=1974203 RepID=UPI002D9B03B4|nr:hypothetical protein [Gracilimonas sp.]
MRDALDGILSESASLINAYNHEPVENSVADIELNSFKRPVSIKTAQDQSYMLLESASDYMYCLIKSLTEPVETIAPWSLTRSILEASALSIWIGNPYLSAEDRVNRSLALRLDGLQEQDRLAKNEPTIDGPSKEQFIKLLSLAEELGAETKVKNGIPTKLGTHLPSITDLCGSELNDPKVYRILSSMAHSQAFALQQLGFQIIGPSEDDSERFDAEKNISNISIAYLCQHAGRAYIRTLCARLKYFGYLTSEVVKMIRNRAEILEIAGEEFLYCIWSEK